MLKMCPIASSLRSFCWSLRTINATLNNVKKSMSTTSCFHRDESVRIGCASGFWGDTSVAAPQLVHHGDIDYLVFDYLSEMTMPLLDRAKQKNPVMGFVPDFAHTMGPLLSTMKERGIKCISNAGGLNPLSCASAVRNACTEAGVEMNVAVVTVDDLLPYLKQSERRIEHPDKVLSVNAYVGAGPIARCLDIGADIVITGRCVDSALTLGPLMHTFKWDWADYDRLASGSLAGHLIECGAQVTGGIFTDWELVTDWHNIGFPVAEVWNKGTFVVTKPPNTGGMVSHATVAEQLVYSIGDPCNYVLPDVVCDFSNVKLTSVLGEGDTVLVSGAKGKRPPPTLKVSATYVDGYSATAVCPVIGNHAVDKGVRTAKHIIKRCEGLFERLGLKEFKQVNVEMLGSEGSYGSMQSNSFTKECVAWIAVEHEQEQALKIFSKEVAPAGTGMAPGFTGIVGGRPTVSPMFKLQSFVIPKSEVKTGIHMNGELLEKYLDTTAIQDESNVDAGMDGTIDTSTLVNIRKSRGKQPKGRCSFPLGALAYTRSGCKGNDANIGVICRTVGYYNILSEALTADRVKKYFADYVNIELSTITRYDLPGIYAFNFVLKDVLDGGGFASLRSDPQWKALGQMLLDFKVQNVPDLLPSTYDRQGQNRYGL